MLISYFYEELQSRHNNIALIVLEYINMKVAILTTGGTFDKVYFDANSEYSIGEPCISSILDEGNVSSDYRVESILKKDSLDITQEEREIIKNAVKGCDEDKIIIIHGTDTMVESAKYLEDIKTAARLVKVTDDDLTTPIPRSRGRITVPTRVVLPTGTEVATT